MLSIEELNNEKRARMQVLIEQIRKEVSCCCSVHRCDAINELLDTMEERWQEERNK
jgi:hypothetical protein